jgi:D-3-phosphoglycerate dehydrogenase / 2-oxoglutarate reductase
MVKRVYVTDTEAGERMRAHDQLVARGYEVRVGDSFAASAEEVVAGIGDANAVCAALGQVTAAAMDAAPNLELVVKTGIGVDNIDVEGARERGLPVLRMGRVNSHGPAEWVIGASIAHFRRFIEVDAAMRRGEWSQVRQPYAGLLPALTGRTLGIAGLGSIGQYLASLGKAHGMDVIAHDPYIPPDGAAAAGARLVSKEELFRTADVVSMNMVLTDETHHFVSTGELALMKPTAILANCSRGPVVDEAALAVALREGVISGAVLDVFELEPPSPDNPLFALDNVLLTPHLGGCTDYGYQEIGALTAELVDRFFKGEPIPRASVVVQTDALVVEDEGVRS